MVINFSTPICCDDFMELINAMGKSFPTQFIFHCDSCGKISEYDREELDAFSGESDD